MNLKSKIKKVLRKHYGTFETLLEHQYETKLTENLLNNDIENKIAWVTYNQVILELKNTLKDNLKVKELQYKLTENTDPNNVCMEVINGIETLTPELERLYYKIRGFR